MRHELLVKVNDLIAMKSRCKYRGINVKKGYAECEQSSLFGVFAQLGFVNSGGDGGAVLQFKQRHH